MSALDELRSFARYNLWMNERLYECCAPAGVRVVVSGHSHMPRVAEEGDVVYVNPGSAGQRRFRLPVSVGFLDIAKGRASARLVTLDVTPPKGRNEAR